LNFYLLASSLASKHFGPHKCDKVARGGVVAKSRESPSKHPSEKKRRGGRGEAWWRARVSID
jgi:hypothetical protein